MELSTVDLEAARTPNSSVDTSTVANGETLTTSHKEEVPGEPQLEGNSEPPVQPEIIENADLEPGNDDNKENDEDKKDENILKGILKRKRDENPNKHVDFNMDINLIPFDEDKDFTIDIQIVKEFPKKVVSYRELFKKIAEEEKAKEKIKAEEKTDESDEEETIPIGNTFGKLKIEEPSLLHNKVSESAPKFKPFPDLFGAETCQKKDDLSHAPENQIHQEENETNVEILQSSQNSEYVQQRSEGKVENGIGSDSDFSQILTPLTNQLDINGIGSLRNDFVNVEDRKYECQAHDNISNEEFKSNETNLYINETLRNSADQNNRDNLGISQIKTDEQSVNECEEKDCSLRKGNNNEYLKDFHHISDKASKEEPRTQIKILNTDSEHRLIQPENITTVYRFNKINNTGEERKLSHSEDRTNNEANNIEKDKTILLENQNLNVERNNSNIPVSNILCEEVSFASKVKGILPYEEVSPQNITDDTSVINPIQCIKDTHNLDTKMVEDFCDFSGVLRDQKLSGSQLEIIKEEPETSDDRNSLSPFRDLGNKQSQSNDISDETNYSLQNTDVDEILTDTSDAKEIGAPTVTGCLQFKLNEVNEISNSNVNKNDFITDLSRSTGDNNDIPTEIPSCTSNKNDLPTEMSDSQIGIRLFECDAEKRTKGEWNETKLEDYQAQVLTKRLTTNSRHQVSPAESKVKTEVPVIIKIFNEDGNNTLSTPQMSEEFSDLSDEPDQEIESTQSTDLLDYSGSLESLDLEENSELEVNNNSSFDDIVSNPCIMGEGTVPDR